ncbi:MAG: hypothetical protein EHM43_08940, partial [Ignavibacteriae bacterium]
NLRRSNRIRRNRIRSNRIRRNRIRSNRIRRNPRSGNPRLIGGLEFGQHLRPHLQLRPHLHQLLADLRLVFQRRRGLGQFGIGFGQGGLELLDAVFQTVDRDARVAVMDHGRLAC